MTGKILLLPKSNLDVYKYDIELPYNEIDYSFSVETELLESFENIISNTQELEEAIFEHFQYLNESDDCEGKKEEIDFLTKIKENIKKYMEEIEFVEILFNDDEILTYLEKNEVLKTKKIIINHPDDLTLEDLNKIKSKYKEYTDNLYFYVKGNSNYISFKDYEQTVTILENIINEVNKFNFSPLEKIMYIYDKVRKRIYTKEDENEKFTVSRNLTDVLLGKEIVCLGYSKIFSALLDRLNIKNNIVYLNGKKRGHARNEVYIKDDKYGIDGVFYFDTTFDSKKEENNNEHLLSYLYFAKTREEMDLLDNNKYINKDFPFFSRDIPEILRVVLEKYEVYELPEDLIKSINHMSKIITGKVLIEKKYNDPSLPTFKKYNKKYNKKYIIEKTEELIDYFTSPIYADTFLEALYNVRKIEYYQEPSIYPFTTDKFYKTVLESEWNFKPKKEALLMCEIYGTKPNTHSKTDMLKYKKETNLDLKIEQVKLAKTLSKVLLKKQEDK